jgi:preprotein translocase subunit YajC
MFFISNAMAQAIGTTTTTVTATGAAQPGIDSMLPQLLPMVAIFGVFYFLLIRPQMKQQKLQKQMVAQARSGDEIVTSSGLYGKITATNEDNSVNVLIARDVVVKLDRAHIQSIKGYDAKAGK